MLKERKKYSLRKYKVGLFSVLVGTGIGFVSLDSPAFAAEAESSTTSAVTSTEKNETLTKNDSQNSPKESVETISSKNEASSINEKTLNIGASFTNENTPDSSEALTNEKTLADKVQPAGKKSGQNEKVSTSQNEKTNASNSSTPQSSSNESSAEISSTVTIPPQTNPNVVSEENSLINVQPLWNKGIKGQGQVVAILDTGLDISHNMFQLLDKTNARYKNEEELEAVKKKAGINYGKCYNDKVIFAYNYSDLNDDIKELDTLSHGTHVSGSAVGNATEPAPTGDIIKGVAPEAQLIFMRLFSEKKGGTQQNFTMVRAVEDAIKLGADTINMSFGSATGLIDDLDDDTRLALEKARKAGVTIVAAAGNYATSGYWHAKPKSETPDYGTVNTPAVDPNVLAIAAYNASVSHKMETTMLEVPNLKNNSELNYGKSDVIPYTLSFSANGEQDYVYLPLGDATSYNNSAVSGKIALVESGGTISDNDKLAELRKAGAKGVLIYQNEEQGNTPTKLFLGGYEASYIPVGIIGNNLGKELALHAGEYKIIIKDNVIKENYEDANKMLYFSGWGVSAEGELKPDIAFPGGMIYSSINNGLYYMNSGTSMASPHAAGSVALVKQVLKERFPSYSAEELETLLQNLLMSTSKPAVNPESSTYYSPRKQGSGLADVAAAAYGDLYLTTKEKKPSITLGNVDDKFEFEVTIHNLSNEEKKLSYNTVVLTDEVEKNRVTLNSRQLEDIRGEVVTVAANSSKTVTIKVDTSKYTDELNKLFKNGYFLEGFTFFKDNATQKDLVSLPFLGFKGNFQDLAAIEKPIYDFKDEEKPFYYYTDDMAETPTKDEGNHFTSLISNAYLDGADHEVVLGEVNGAYDANNIFISPNGDGDYDTVKLKAVILRDVNNIHVAVYAKDDTKRTTPLYEAGNDTQKKSEFGWAIYARDAVISASEWNGTDKDGNQLPDGEYQYVITYRPAAAGAKKQELNFNVKIDTTAPVLENKNNLYNKDTRVFNPGKIVELSSGLNSDYLSYEKDGETLSVEKQDDGTFVLPENIDLSTVRYYVWDKVSNTTTIDINGNLVARVQPSYDNTNTEEATVGNLEVSFTDESGSEYSLYPEIARYIVLDENGNRVDVELNKYFETTLPTLPAGKYTIKVVDQDNKVTWLSPKEVVVNITDSSAKQVVDFKFSYADTNRLSIVFNQKVPENTKVVAIDKKGQTFELSLGKYNKQTFEKLLFNGEYKINIILPEGFVADKNNFDYDVTNGIHVVNINVSKAIKPSNKPSKEQEIKEEQKEKERKEEEKKGQEKFENNNNNNKLPRNEHTKPLHIDSNDNKKVLEKTSQNSSTKKSSLPKTSSTSSTNALLTLMAAPLLLLTRRKKHSNTTK